MIESEKWGKEEVVEEEDVSERSWKRTCFLRFRLSSCLSHGCFPTHLSRLFPLLSLPPGDEAVSHLESALLRLDLISVRFLTALAAHYLAPHTLRRCRRWQPRS